MRVEMAFRSLRAVVGNFEDLRSKMMRNVLPRADVVGGVGIPSGEVSSGADRDATLEGFTAGGRFTRTEDPVFSSAGAFCGVEIRGAGGGGAGARGGGVRAGGSTRAVFSTWPSDGLDGGVGGLCAGARTGSAAFGAGSSCTIATVGAGSDAVSGINAVSTAGGGAALVIFGGVIFGGATF